MRIDRDTLLKVAKLTVNKSVKENRNIICVYLTGSLLREDPLLAGTTDIDLFFVHSVDPIYEREVISYNNEVHFDIAHIYQTAYDQPRNLRGDPWLGSSLCEAPLLLHDQQHWFDFIQASVCAQFYHVENILTRSRRFSEDARRRWMDLLQDNSSSAPRKIQTYLKILEESGNAIASLTGHPLTERRFLIDFETRSVKLGRPGLYPGLMDLFMSDEIKEEEWQKWIESWQASLKAVDEQDIFPIQLHPHKRNYYLNPVREFIAEKPSLSLWLLLRNWTMSMNSLPPENPFLEEWADACTKLNLHQDVFSERLESMDIYLDSVEETIETFASRFGAAG